VSPLRLRQAKMETKFFRDLLIVMSLRKIIFNAMIYFLLPSIIDLAFSNINSIYYIDLKFVQNSLCFNIYIFLFP